MVKGAQAKIVENHFYRFLGWKDVDLKGYREEGHKLKTVCVPLK